MTRTANKVNKVQSCIERLGPVVLTLRVRSAYETICARDILGSDNGTDGEK
jgi:hypothetical protein